MRLLFASTAGEGHLGPIIPLAREATRLGHDVWMATPPRAKATVEKHGIASRPFDDSDAEARAAIFAKIAPGTDPIEENIVVAREVFGRLNTSAALSSMRALIDELRPDLVVREPFEASSWLAAEAAGVPTAQVACSTWRSMPFATKYLLEGVGDLARAHGIRPCPDPGQGCRAFITMTPAALERSLALPETVLRVAPERPFAARGTASDPPLVFVCFGTVAGIVPGVLGRIGPAVCEALSELRVRVRFAIGRGVDRTELGPVPDNVEVADFIPFHDILPKASLAIGHGGYGTTMGILAAGVPSLVLPLFSYDQWDNAAAVAESGAGRTLDIARQAPDEIAQTARSILSDAAMDKRARQIASDMASQLSLASVVDRLESIAA